jgi:hypothetical protein
MKNRIISNKKKNGGLIPSPMESAPTSGIQITTHVIIRGISIIWETIDNEKISYHVCHRCLLERPYLQYWDCTTTSEKKHDRRHSIGSKLSDNTVIPLLRNETKVKTKRNGHNIYHNNTW